MMVLAGRRCKFAELERARDQDAWQRRFPLPLRCPSSLVPPQRWRSEATRLPLWGSWLGEAQTERAAGELLALS